MDASHSGLPVPRTEGKPNQGPYRHGHPHLLMTVPPDAADPKLLPHKLRGRPPKAQRSPTPISPATLELQRKFGADFRGARIAVGLTQAEVGQLIGSIHTTVSKVERGLLNLTIDVMQRLAVAVRCSLVLHLNPDGGPQSARLEPKAPPTNQ